jgi:23S rRNA (guanine2445-N2)-methyltransferase / 23S rRNA (guanine2069-N7)-methyltransferase
VPDARVAAFRARLNKNLKRLARWRRESEGWATCFRAFDRDMPELPLAVDVFSGHATDGMSRLALNVIAWAPRHGGGQPFGALVSACADAAAEDVAAALGTGQPPAAVTGHTHRFVQIREPGVGGELSADDVDESTVALTVREGPARLLVRLGARRDPGLFLDHRVTRRLVAEAAKGKDVLNLFAYTASFSVQAGLAGARQTTSVDLSVSTCRWAEANLRNNGLDGDHRVVVGDALDLESLDVDDADVIVIDPPSFSKSRRSHGDFDVQRDHAHVLGQALRRLRRKGEIWFSCNRRGFTLTRDALPVDVVVDDLTAATTPPDFRRAPHACFRLRRA